MEVRAHTAQRKWLRIQKREFDVLPNKKWRKEWKSGRRLPGIVSSQTEEILKIAEEESDGEMESLGLKIGSSDIDVVGTSLAHRQYGTQCTEIDKLEEKVADSRAKRNTSPTVRGIQEP